MLTVVTPTYNRSHTLGNCYKSLCAQTDKRFNWLIIDDGSTDDTQKLVDGWKSENIIEIVYIKKENGGKASALNVAIENLQAKYAVCLDSDDTFYPETIEIALKNLALTEEEKECCGLLALRTNSDGMVMGLREIPKNMKKVTAKDIFLRLRLRTEVICFYKTSILKKYRFPEFEGEKFVSPAWMQYEVTQKYYFKTVWDRMCCCIYEEDGLTKNKKSVILRNPKGYTCVKKYSFNLAPNIYGKVKHGIMYNCGCILSNDKNWLNNSQSKLWALLLRPIAHVVCWIRFKKCKG